MPQQSENMLSRRQFVKSTALLGFLGLGGGMLASCGTSGSR